MKAASRAQRHSILPLKPGNPPFLPLGAILEKAAQLLRKTLDFGLFSNRSLTEGG